MEPSDPVAPGRDAACPNCGTAAPDAYCPRCGQRQRDPRRSPLSWLSDLVSEELALGARTPRTLGTLVLRPGRLTLEWIRGRRVRYLGPVRLYLVVVAAFFAVTFFLGFPLGQGLGAAFERSELPIGTDVQAIALQAMAGRLQAVLTAWAFLLVPVFAAWLSFLHGREDRVVADHVVFSLHQHAVFLLLATVAWPFFFLGRAGVIAGLLVLIGAALHSFLAYRRVYRDRRAWLRFVPVAVGWGGLVFCALVYGGWEFARMSEADFDPAVRYHAGLLWADAQGRDAPEDTAVLRALQRRSLDAFRSVEEPYLLDWDPYRMADLEVELGEPRTALERIEAFREVHPEHPLPLGLAALAAARAGETALARLRAEAFLARAEEDPPGADTPVYPRFLFFLEHARELLGGTPPTPPGAPPPGPSPRPAGPGSRWPGGPWPPAPR